MKTNLRQGRARLAVFVALVMPVILGSELYGQDVDKARTAFASEIGTLGLSEDDIKDARVSDAYVDQRTGQSYVYLYQTYQGFDVHNAIATIVISANGVARVTGSRFLPDLGNRITVAESAVSDENAVRVALREVQMDRVSKIDAAAVLSNDLAFVEDRAGEMRLAWKTELRGNSRQGFQHHRVWTDASTGDILSRENLAKPMYDPDALPPSVARKAPKPASHAAKRSSAAANSYLIFPPPAESPLHPHGVGTPQSTVANPANATASPSGWHDDGSVAYTTTRGNNVYAFADTDGNDLPDATIGSYPDGGALLDFNFPYDQSVAPRAALGNIAASVTDLFYWMNVIHDLTYLYGFDEPAGNFQVDNFGNGGNSGDDAIAKVHAQGNCNAIESVGSDGVSPIFSTYICDIASPDRDGALDHGAVAFMAMRAMANRLVGGPGTTSCLSNAEAFNVGLADWFALWLTQQSGDVASDARGIGTYLIGQAANGPGLRSVPYSTDFGVNGLTYDDIKTAGTVHEVGEIMASMLWDLNWALIGGSGSIPAGDNGLGGGFSFDSNRYTGTGGNNLLMQLVVDALKLTPCSPGFIDFRDEILSADQTLTGGANACSIWHSFAQRGLGFSADQGLSSSKVDGTEAFDVPPAYATCAQPQYLVSGKVFLEGPYAGNDTMSTAVNGLIPFESPYSGPPWNYAPADSTTSIPVGAVDWIYLESRPDSGAAAPIDSTVAFLLEDGSLIDTSGSALPRLRTGTTDSAYVVVRHRNHLDAMTRVAVIASGDTLKVDLTTAGAAFGLDPVKDLGSGRFGLFAGDGDADGDAIVSDFNLWFADTKALATGYIASDYDLDGDALISDFNLWFANTKGLATSQVP